MKKFTNILTAFVIFLFIISLSVVFTLNFKPLYYFDVNFLNISQSSGYSEEIIIENYDILIDYNSIFNSNELEFNGLAMSVEGKIHFEEVKEIFVGLQVLLIVCAVLSIFAVVFKVLKKDFVFLKLASFFTVIIPCVLGFFIALNWEKCFITFHEIAFDNDYWIFDPYKDEVINILPDEFFMHCAIMIVSIALIFAVGMFLCWRKLKKTHK